MTSKVIEQQPRLLKETEARAFLGGMSRPMLYRLRQSGEIKSIRIGASLYFDTDHLHAFLDRISHGIGKSDG